MSVLLLYLKQFEMVQYTMTIRRVHAYTQVNPHNVPIFFFMLRTVRIVSAARLY